MDVKMNYKRSLIPDLFKMYKEDNIIATMEPSLEEHFLNEVIPPYDKQPYSFVIGKSNLNFTMSC